MGSTRRNLLKYAGAVAAGAAGYRAYTDGMLNNLSIQRILEILDVSRDLGTTVRKDNMEVTVTDAARASQVRLKGSGETVTEPSTGRLFLARVAVTNRDIKPREPPNFNLAAYDYMSKEEPGLSTVGQNDIALYANDKIGTVGEIDQPSIISYSQLTTPNTSYPAYPPSPGSELGELDPTESGAGWVYGIINADGVPRIRVDISGNATYWALPVSKAE